MIEHTSDDPDPGSQPDPPPIAESVLNALVERVDEAIARYRKRIAETDEHRFAAGAAEIELIDLTEAVVRIAQGLQHDAVSSLEARRSASDYDHSAFGNHRRARSLRAEVGMARGVGNAAGQHSIDVAVILRDLPLTHALLRDGVISAAVAAAVCTEVKCLDAQQRSRVDELVAASLPGMSPREASAAARRHVLALDPTGAAARANAARATRHVRLHRLPDAMAELTVRGPCEQVISAWQRLQADAMAIKHGTTTAPEPSGDPEAFAVPALGRTTRQITADVALAALTGVPVDTADGGSDSARVEIGLLLRPETLFGIEDTPGVLTGYGPIPAALCRRLAGNEAVWVRRLFTDDRGEPRDADERRRRFPERLSRLIRATDGQCLRPYCDCDITQIDHARAHSRGGRTTLANGQGVCGHDNLVKESPGWDVRVNSSQSDDRQPDDRQPDDRQPDDRQPGDRQPADRQPGDRDARPDSITWVTPTGHSYTARRHHRDGRGPSLHAYRAPRHELSPVEGHFHDLVAANRTRG